MQRHTFLAAELLPTWREKKLRRQSDEKTSPYDHCQARTALTKGDPGLHGREPTCGCLQVGRSQVLLAECAPEVGQGSRACRADAADRHRALRGDRVV